uniref:Uncharacterized protein n=1 Tax=Parascaris univalens TaxID=6257 RepID=A0A915AHP5_PARUN
FSLLFLRLVLVDLSTVSVNNSSSYIKDSGNFSWVEIVDTQLQPDDAEDDLILEYHPVVANASGEGYLHKFSTCVDVRRAVFVSAVLAAAAVVLVVVTSKLLNALSRTVCRLRNQPTNQHGAITSQLQANHNSTNTAIWSRTHENDPNLTKVVDDGKNVPFNFDKINYFSGGGMESGFIPEVARHYRDVVGGSEAYNASTLSSSFSSDETITDEFSDEGCSTVSGGSFQLDLFGFHEVVVD